MGGLELPCFFYNLTVFAKEIEVARGLNIVEHGGEEEWGGVGGGVFVRKRLPIDERGGLGVLVHHLAVGALALHEELEGVAGEGEVAHAVDGVEGVEGVATEVPAEAGAGGVAGREVAGYETGLACGVREGAELLDGYGRPGEGVVEGGVGSGDGGEVVLPPGVLRSVGGVDAWERGIEVGELGFEGGRGGGFGVWPTAIRSGKVRLASRLGSKWSLSSRGWTCGFSW